CPSCGGDRLRPLGIGTERVEAEIQGLFPSARPVRMDRDTTTRKDSHRQLLGAFRRGEANILIGTQMVAKGLDFPNVTLVGVVSADTALNVPDFRASERAFQLLSQVAGRAGRAERPGTVLIQTFNPTHEAVVAAANHDYEGFYAREIEYRRELGYPPFARLANLVCGDEDGSAADRRLRSVAAVLEGTPDIRLLGPAPCPLSRLREKYRHHLLIKCFEARDPARIVGEALERIPARERALISVDIDPISLA
ncbi:MAG: primosomal protein N', partial [Armatimonadota bacterium]